MNIKELEIKEITSIDIQIEELNDKRQSIIEELNDKKQSIIDCQGEAVEAYYRVLDFMRERKYTPDIESVLKEYESFIQGDYISASAMDIICNCSGSLKMLSIYQNAKKESEVEE